MNSCNTSIDLCSGLASELEALSTPLSIVVSNDVECLWNSLLMRSWVSCVCFKIGVIYVELRSCVARNHHTAA